jgi:hypothetical protein
MPSVAAARDDDATAQEEPMRERPGRLRLLVTHPVTRGVAAGFVVLAGLALLLLAIVVGDCSFAGGRCPADPVPWWEDDVFGTAATGLAMIVAAPMLARRPTWQGVGRAAAAAAIVALLGGWLIAEAARSGF